MIFLLSISFDESTEFRLHVSYIGLFAARGRKRKNWNVIHRTFPFLQRQFQLEQSIGMSILRLNVDGQLVNQSVSQSVSQFSTTLPLLQKVRRLAHLFIQKSYILPFQSNKNDSCVDSLDYMLLPTPPLVDEEGIWRFEREDSRGRGRGSHKAFMIWKVRARCIKYSVQDPSLGSYTVSIGNCIQ